MAALKNFTRYASQFLKNSFVKNKLEFLIFFVSSYCNCRCGICFYWQELNKSGGLSIDEVKKISSSIGSLRTLLLSGGEPFLRDDLYEVCKPFIEDNKISVLAIPTNGILTERILIFCKSVLGQYPHLGLSVSISLDGFKELHDSVRGVDGVFDKATATIRELLVLKKCFNNLEVIVNTVVTNRNIGELQPFMDFVFNNFDIDFHDFELLRGNYKDKNLFLPPLGLIKQAHRLIVQNRMRYLKRKNANLLERFAVISLLKLSQMMKECFLSGKKPLYDCSAGKNIAVLDASGDIRLCELLPAVGNVRGGPRYNLSAALNSPQAKALKKKIKSTCCSCTHVCFIKLTISGYFRSIFHLAYNYFMP